MPALSNTFVGSGLVAHHSDKINDRAWSRTNDARSRSEAPRPQRFTPVQLSSAGSLPI